LNALQAETRAALLKQTLGCINSLVIALTDTDIDKEDRRDVGAKQTLNPKP
jgi:hypothetical protein